MRIFHCDHCGNAIFFENVRCLRCSHDVGYLPDVDDMGSLDRGDDERWRAPAAPGRSWRRCANWTAYDVCNWLVDDGDAEPLCESCRLTRVIPDLDVPGHREAWYKLEVAKRRLVYTLRRLALPLAAKDDDPAGLAFEFLADPAGPDTPPVLTGHAGGVVTINIAEADDAEREKRRVALREPYRTLLGHLRHESGHHYWDRCIAGTPRLEPFRALFGDERRDYGEALAAYYRDGAPADWQERCVSAYATAHPWEDWAETWAHYLHVVDTLETAAACGVALRPTRPDEPRLAGGTVARAVEGGAFDDLIGAWFPLTYLLNNLNRGLGLADAYPFVLSPPAVAKLRFVHDAVAGP